MKYKLLAFDIDGTLTNSKKEITPATKAAILKAAKQGCTIAIASGRPVKGIEAYEKELGLEEIGGYIIALNGGMVYSCKDKRIISNISLPMEYYGEIIDLAKDNKVNIMTYDGDCVVTETPDDKYILIEERINGLGKIVTDNLKEYLNYEVPKFLMVGDGDYLAQVEKKVHAQLSDRMDVYRSEPFFLEVLPKNINKASALEKLLTELNITRQEIAAFGDGYNDLSMIEYAGLGVAMSNGNDVVKEHADYIAPSNEEDGIVTALEKFVLD